MNPIVVYECEECGQTFTSELGRRAHDAVCIPRNMPGQSTFSIKTDFLLLSYSISHGLFYLYECD